MFGFSRKRQEPAAERIEPSISGPAGEPIQNTATADSWDVLRGIFQELPRVAGTIVNEKTAMRVSSVYACVRIIAGAIAGLPIPIYEKDAEGNRQRIEHKYWPLLNQQPVPAFSAAAFWELIVTQVLLHGDGLAYLIRNRAGDVTGIMPLLRSQVQIEPQFTEGDPKRPVRLKYLIRTDGGTFGAQQEDVLHFPGLGFDGVSSKSVIHWGALQSTGVAIAADDFAANFFEKGATPQHAITTEKKMGESQQKALRDAWLAKYSGRGPNGIPLILTEGMSVKELTLSAKDAQLLESRQWQAIDIARAFGVPPHLIGETTKQTSWGSGLEQLMTSFVIFTIGPHLRRFQPELNRKLFRRGDKFAEFNVTGLLRGDHAARADYYQKALGGTQAPGWMTQDEVRKLENLRPKGGDADQLHNPEPSTNATNQPATASQG